MRRTGVVVLAALALLAPVGARADFSGASFWHECHGSIVAESAGPQGLPTARCSAAGFAKPDGRFSLEGTLRTPADGYAPGIGSLAVTAVIPATVVIPEESDVVDFVATIRIDEASSTVVRRLNGIQPIPKVNVLTQVAMFGSAPECCASFAEYFPMTNTQDGESEFEPQTITVLGSLSDFNGPVPAGPADIYLYVEAYFTTEIGAMGSAHASVGGQVVSIELA